MNEFNMDNMSMPIFRAEVDGNVGDLYDSQLHLLTEINNRYYVIGYLVSPKIIKVFENCKKSSMGTIQLVENRDYFNIKPDTLSINFPDKFDSYKNPVFASLNKDGKGGDICTREDNEGERVCCYRFANFHFCSFGKNTWQNYSSIWTQYAYSRDDYFSEFNKININRDFIHNNFRVVGIYNESHLVQDK